MMRRATRTLSRCRRHGHLNQGVRLLHGSHHCRASLSGQSSVRGSIRLLTARPSRAGTVRLFSTDNGAAVVAHDPPVDSDLPVVNDQPVEQEERGLAVATEFRPKQWVEYLDKYIIGQNDAKRAVAIALRNRWRRQRLSADMRPEIIPKNILMIGPTGCGKTEIARRIAKLSDAPFIKVEATKFTEVGFHGRDVDQIIRDLVEISVNMTKKRRAEAVRVEAKKVVEDKCLDAVLGENSRPDTKEAFRGMLKRGELDDRRIEVDLPTDRGSLDKGPPGGGVMMDNMALQDFLQKARLAFSPSRKMTEKRKLPIKEAWPMMLEAEMEKLVDMSDVTREAVQAVEENGIVFIDEIDKICNPGEYRGADASAEGVQRDLLPLIEGSAISTKYGNINTDYILFIGSGAFSSCKPSDLLAELQGRLPIRVSLSALTEQDMYRILTEPVNNMVKQQVALLATENITLDFTDDAIREIARVATLVNRTVENIGARRLHTVLERIVEEISFSAPENEPGSSVVVDKGFVEKRVSDMLVKSDLSRFIL